MKSILLASASLVGFAGAAAAEVTFGGSASVGYNDDIEGGFYWEGDLSVSMSQELNNGLTAAASFGLNITDNNLGNSSVGVDGNWVVSLTSETAGMYFGDTDQAAEALWSGIDGMEADNFDEDGIGDAVLRGELTYGAVTAALSYNATAAGGLEGLQVAADATFGNFNVGVAFQDDAFTGNQILGVSAGTTFGAAGVNFAYADNGVDSSIGIGLSYPAGPVTLGAYYAINDVAGDAYGISAAYASGAITVDAGYDVDPGASDGNFDVEVTYDVGNGIKAWAGVLDSGDAYYVAGTVDLGGGASLLVSYAQDDNNGANDEIGGPELLHGTTAKVSFSF